MALAAGIAFNVSVVHLPLPILPANPAKLLNRTVHFFTLILSPS